jgi:hypothetical protein
MAAELNKRARALNGLEKPLKIENEPLTTPLIGPDR